MGLGLEKDPGTNVFVNSAMATTFTLTEASPSQKQPPAPLPHTHPQTATVTAQTHGDTSLHGGMNYRHIYTFKLPHGKLNYAHYT